MAETSNGYWIKERRAKPGAYETIDNVTKFALDTSDYEEVEEWVAYTPEEIAEREALAAKVELEATRDAFEAFIEGLFAVDNISDFLKLITNKDARALMERRKELRMKRDGGES